MNLLIENAPDYIIVGGKKIKIKTDFALWVKFIISCQKNDKEKLYNSICEIFDNNIPDNVNECFEQCQKWLFPDEKKQTSTTEKTNNNHQKPFDFDMDGSVIYCELWEYFPNLMQRGISFHEGMELIQILMMNDKTVLWHRAFARCGELSKLDKEQRKYWQKQRALYSIKNKNSDIDSVMCGDFW